MPTAADNLIAETIYKLQENKLPQLPAGHCTIITSYPRYSKMPPKDGQTFTH